jgi:hypothetical protein
MLSLSSTSSPPSLGASPERSSWLEPMLRFAGAVKPKSGHAPINKKSPAVDAAGPYYWLR